MGIFETDLERCCSEIEAARAAVENAQIAYGNGKGVDALNRASRRLADAHSDYRMCSGGNVPTHR
jgi:hypothetical protein